MANGNQPGVELQPLKQRPPQLSTQISVDPSNRQFWEGVYKSIDANGDGKISYDELKRKLKEVNRNLPKGAARAQLQKYDSNGDGYLDFEEFLDLLEMKENRALFYSAMNGYVNVLVPRRQPTDQTDSEYEDEYSCCPPQLGMIIISILEIVAFIYNTTVTENFQTDVLIYNPHRRIEAWRFLTYMFVHNGVFHLLVNLLVQILLGIPLEMVHGWWRVVLIYLVGVVAGSLGTSISDPYVYLAGASGGVYAIMTAHVATIILNWSQMQFPIAQLLIFLIIATVDVGTAVYNRYAKTAESETIGYAAHLAGAIAGLLVGINVLKNLKVLDWENKLWWAALVTFITLILAAVIWNVAFPSYFPPQWV